MKEKYYKVLRTNRASFYDSEFIWPLRKPVEVRDAINSGPCGKGLHLAKTVNDGFRHAGLPARVFEAEPLSPILGSDDTKIRVAKAQLAKEITPDWVLKVNRLIAGLGKIKYFRKDKKPPLKAWRIFETRNAAEDVAWNAARDAAWDAAGAAAEDAAGDAARGAAGDAAEDIAGDVAWNAAGDAARDAALQARIIVCDGLKLDDKHRKHAKARMDVWRRGYGLLCDVDGVLYVYKMP